MFYIVLAIVIILIVSFNNNRKEQQRLELDAQEKKRLELEDQHKRELEEQERQEQERRHQEEQAKRNEIHALFEDFDELRINEFEFVPEDKFKKLLELKHSTKDNTLTRIWNEEYKYFITKMNNYIYMLLESIQDVKRYYYICIDAIMISTCFKKLKYLNETVIFDDAISELDKFYNIADFYHAFWIKYEDYGNCKLDIPFEDMSEDSLKLDLEQVENHQQSLKSFEKPNIDCISDYTKIVQYLDVNDIFASSCTMWYYAWKKPFIVESFERACEAFRFYSNSNGCECVEVMLAKIYNWNSLGGSNLVMEHQREILDWLERIININSDIKNSEGGSLSFIEFASTLAWLELYDLELLVLKKLVELKVQLWPDAQERLKFLSSGGTANIKIYEPQNEIFSFDTSSAEWKESEYNIFSVNLQ